MSITVTGTFERCYSNSKGTYFSASIKEENVKHALQPFGKPYYFWDKDLTFPEKPLKVKITLEYGNGNDVHCIHKKAAYLIKMKHSNILTDIKMYFAFIYKEYNEIISCNNFSEEVIRFEFEYDVETNIRMLKHYICGKPKKYKNNQTVLFTRYDWKDKPEDYNIAWKIMQKKAITQQWDLILKSDLEDVKKLAQPLGREYYFWDLNMLNENYFDDPLSVTLSFHYHNQLVGCEKNDCKACCLNDCCQMCNLDGEPCKQSVKTEALLHHTMHRGNIVVMYVSYGNEKFYDELIKNKMYKSDRNISSIILSFEKETYPKVEKIDLVRY